MAQKSTTLTKVEVRQKCRSQLKLALGKGEKPRWDAQILAQAQNQLPARGRGALFYPLLDEPDILSLMQQMNWTWAFPRVQANQMTFHEVSDLTGFNPGSWGVKEPDPKSRPEISLSSCDVIFVPGLAFDVFGTRLGRGQGFYDRALAGFKGLKIGVGYHVQILSEPLMREVHDVLMDIVITEQICFKRKDRSWPHQ